MNNVLDKVKSCVTPRMNDELCKPYEHDEILHAVKQLHPSKAPKPNGMNPYFYQKFWLIIGPKVPQAAWGVLNGGTLPPSFNDAHCTNSQEAKLLYYPM